MFSTLVKPQFNSGISRNIEALTGIATADVQEAPFFEKAIRMLFSWCGSLEEELMIIQWSENDRRQILKEMALKDYVMTPAEEKLMGMWYDFQPEFGQVVGLERLISLEMAISFTGTDFLGRQHDALYDARNTAFLFNVVRNPDENCLTLEKIADYLRPHKSVQCLGDMFDFAGLMLTA